MGESKSNLLKEITDEFFKAIENQSIITDKEVINNLRDLFLVQEVPSPESIKKILFPI